MAITIWQLNNMYARKEMDATSVARAQIRDIFYDIDTAWIRDLLLQDLKKYFDDKDISYMKLITLDFFVPAFIDRISHVYDEPPIIKALTEKGALDKNNKDLAKIRQLLNETKYATRFNENQERTILHNTILVQARYYKELDRMYIQNGFNIGNTRVHTYPGFIEEAAIIAYETYNQMEEKTWIVWDHYNKTLFEAKGDIKYEPESRSIIADTKRAVGDNKDLVQPGGIWPWVKYQHRADPADYWGSGIDSIIELVRAMNILLTVTQDDSIQETIRILFLNFDPAGNKGDKGQLKVGLRNPVFKEQNLPGKENTLDAKILSADLYNKEILDLIERLADILGSMHNVDSVLKTKLQQDISGIALRLRKEPILQRWSKDINNFRYSDMELITALVRVHNYHRGAENKGEVAQVTDKLIDEKVLDNLVIDYMEPQIITDEKEEYELEQNKWQDGTSNPIEWVLRAHPDFYGDRDTAIKYIEENRKLLKDLGIIAESQGLLGNMRGGKRGGTDK